ncbi:MAG TPA: TIM barrel protein [Kiritimatiellia bacterium]|nr:TIM barrel protein [Kiritimatiellia bacterium]
MIIPGLVSITFRKLSVDEVIELASSCGLRSIEWGADVHVKPDDPAAARGVGERTRAAGLTVSSYGSYYRAGERPESFDAILETARSLGAPRIRVWAGRKDAHLHTSEERCAVTDDLGRIAGLAAMAGIGIALEFHGGTLTSSAESAAALLRDLDDMQVKSYWQIRVDATPEEALSDLHLLAPWLCHAHVFQWHPGSARHPLADGADVWPRYLAALAALARPIHAQLEYVLGDAPAQVRADAATLRDLISRV